MSNEKDIRKMIDDLSAQGWRIEHGKHYRCFHPNGKNHLTIAKSPSCPFAVKNIRADIKRIERQNQPTKQREYA